MSHSNAQLQPPSKCFPDIYFLTPCYECMSYALLANTDPTMPINKVSYAGHTEHTESITKYISFIIPNLKILCLLTPLLCFFAIKQTTPKYSQIFCVCVDCYQIAAI